MTVAWQCEYIENDGMARKKVNSNHSKPSANKNSSTGEDPAESSPNAFRYEVVLVVVVLVLVLVLVVGGREGGKRVCLGEVKARPIDTIGVSLGHLSKSEVPTSNAPSSPTPLQGILP